MVEKGQPQEAASMPDNQRFRRRQMHVAVTTQVVMLGKIARQSHHALIEDDAQCLSPVGFEHFLDRRDLPPGQAIHAKHLRQRSPHFGISNQVYSNLLRLRHDFVAFFLNIKTDICRGIDM